MLNRLLKSKKQVMILLIVWLIAINTYILSFASVLFTYKSWDEIKSWLEQDGGHLKGINYSNAISIIILLIIEIGYSWGLIKIYKRKKSN
jgi:hypothetical protein